MTEDIILQGLSSKSLYDTQERVKTPEYQSTSASWLKFYSDSNVVQYFWVIFSGNFNFLKITQSKGKPL
jgi:hypothetical protein